MSVSNPIETIRAKILDDAEEQANKIVSVASKKAEEESEKLKADMEKVRVASKEEIRQLAEKKRMERTAEEKVEQHRRIEIYKAEIIDSAFEQALQSLKAYCESEKYAETLRYLIVEAGIALRGGNLIVSSNEKDQRIMTREFLNNLSDNIKRKTGIETNLTVSSTPLICVGGVIVSRPDEEASVNNTFEERLRRLKQTESSELETILFR